MSDDDTVTCPKCGLIGPTEEADTFSEMSYGCPACGCIWPKTEDDDEEDGA